MTLPATVSAYRLYLWFFLGIVLSTFLLGGSSRSDAAEGNPWSFAGFTKYRDALYIDKTRLTRTADATVVFPVLIKPAPQSLFRQSLKKEMPSYNQYLQDFQALVLVMEMNCPEKRMRFLVIQFRDAADQALHTATDARAPWRAVKPGSLWQELAGTVCP